MDYSSEESQANKPLPQHQHEHKASTTELLANAQLLAGAAFNQKGANKAKLSEAAEEMLAAGEDYGKLGEGSYGAYIEKAEGFLHKYHASESDRETGNSTAGNTERAMRPAKYDLEEESEPGGTGNSTAGKTERAARPAKYDLEQESESGGTGNSASGNTDRASRPAKYDLEHLEEQSESGGTGSKTERAARPAKYDLEEESESGKTERAARPAKYDLDESESGETGGSTAGGNTERAARPAKYDLEEESESGGGFGGLVKMAQGFLKK